MVVATLLFLIGFATTAVTFEAAKDYLPKRPNFRVKEIPTSAGMSFLPIILLTFAFGVSGGLRWDVLIMAGYVSLAVCVGFYDDVRGDGSSRGFRGHFGALLRGRLTSGLVKVISLAGGALFVGWAIFGFGLRGFVAAFLLAGCVNLGNLFDVRPGRAVKFVGLAAVVLIFVAPVWSVVAVSGVVGGALSLFNSDLEGRMMLGDAGAAGLGAVLGCLVVASGSYVVWPVAGAAVVLLTFVAEFSSISRVIEEVRVLRWFDGLGRER